MKFDDLRTALEFYADETNHDLDLDKTSQFTTSQVYEDRGERARLALQDERDCRNDENILKTC